MIANISVDAIRISMMNNIFRIWNVQKEQATAIDLDFVFSRGWVAHNKVGYVFQGVVEYAYFRES